MKIDRRHLMLPALALGLLAAVSASALSAEEEAIAKRVEAFRTAQIAQDAKALDELNAIHLRHDDVGHHHIRTLRPISFQPHGAAIGGLDLIAGALQDLAQRIENDRIVVDQQDSCHRFDRPPRDSSHQAFGSGKAGLSSPATVIPDGLTPKPIALNYK